MYLDVGWGGDIFSSSGRWGSGWCLSERTKDLLLAVDLSEHLWFPLDASLNTSINEALLEQPQTKIAMTDISSLREGISASHKDLCTGDLDVTLVCQTRGAGVTAWGGVAHWKEVLECAFRECVKTQYLLSVFTSQLPERGNFILSPICLHAVHPLTGPEPCGQVVSDWNLKLK